jgi:hypothetical protein
MLADLKTRTLLTTTDLMARAADLGLSSTEPDRLAIAIGGLVIRQLRGYFCRQNWLQ